MADFIDGIYWIVAALFVLKLVWNVWAPISLARRHVARGGEKTGISFMFVIDILLGSVCIGLSFVGQGTLTPGETVLACVVGLVSSLVLMFAAGAVAGWWASRRVSAENGGD